MFLTGLATMDESIPTGPPAGVGWALSAIGARNKIEDLYLHTGKNKPNHMVQYEHRASSTYPTHAFGGLSMGKPANQILMNG